MHCPTSKAGRAEDLFDFDYAIKKVKPHMLLF